MRNVIAAGVFLLTATIAEAVELRVATFNIGAAFDTSSGEFVFVHGIGPQGEPDHDAVAAVLARIDADVVALQEIHTVDLSQDLGVLAAGLGYPHVHVSNLSRAFDTTLRVVLMSRHPFLQQTSITSPAGSREIARNHPAVIVDVPGTDRNPLIVTAHLKAGTTQADRFRRAVEMHRLVEHLNGPAGEGIENWVILGDFNLSSTPTVFDALPTNLPGTYSLGPDVTFPVSYHTNPLNYFSSRVPFRLDPRQLDGSTSTFNTTQSGGPAIDRVMISPALASRPVQPEIYNSAFDISNESGLPKAGTPLDPSTSNVAPDHYAIFADLELDAADRYTFTTAGETIREDFTGFLGVVDPQRWTTSGGGWLGRDDGSSGGRGFRSYGAIHEGSLGIIQGDDPATATASFTNQSATPLTALEISLSAEVHRAVEDGTDDGFEVDLLMSGEAFPLPELTFAAGGGRELGGRAIGLNIMPGEHFELRFSFSRGDAPALPPDVFINEFHYDNAGTDAGEFIEVVVGPGFTGDLADVIVYSYNGGNGQTYGTATPLSQFTAGAITSSGHRFFSAAFQGLQNGAPDGFALVSISQVLEFLSYEGSFTAMNGPALGLTSTDVGVSQNGTEPIGESALGLTGNGRVAGEFSWTKFAGLPHSPGQANDGQTFTNFPPAQGIAINELEVTSLPDDLDSDGDGISDADEAIFGTDPFDPNSRYTIVFTRPDPATARLAFPTVAGRSYRVQASGDLVEWENSASMSGDGLERVLDFLVDPEADSRFYRVVVAME